MAQSQPESRSIRLLLLIALFEVANASYLAAFDTPSIFYHVNVVLHVVLGIPLAAAILLKSIPALIKASARHGGPQAILLRLLAALALAFTGSGVALAWTGTASPYRGLLRVHIGSAVAGGALLLALIWIWAKRPNADSRSLAIFRWNCAVLIGAFIFPLSVKGWLLLNPSHVATITNPKAPPLTPLQEGGGEGSPFFPSSNRTVGDQLLPADFFLDSKGSCGSSGCHPDIVTQWEGSMHHFSSFNNQWYRKSIEYMQDTIGTKSSKWCGGCHDMAILLTGRMDRPIREQIDTPEAQAGIGCLVCHSIVHVNDTMGQGGFVLEYPEMHRLAASKSPIMNAMHDYMVRLDPAPHRATLMKPFHRESTPQFCSSCHKVHLDSPVNNYRWLRGFNEYDPWQQSGVSGEGARAFYYPPEPKTCTKCHMPLVPSKDAANINGMVHSHRFPGANTAIPFVNDDKAQMDATVAFLQGNSVTVDIFGIADAGGASTTEPRPGDPGNVSDAPDAGMSTHFVGEEGVLGSQEAGGETGPAPGQLIAPLRADAEGTTTVPLERGREYLVEVVTRTRNVGHMFPGGTVDAFDVWVELKGEDETGKVIYWSGWVEEQQRGGRSVKGPVDPSAHFYRSFLLDAHGNHINKRNAWSARALLYARLIPPGAADTSHFLVRIPEDCGEVVTLTAQVNYRKFMWWNTQWAYAGERDPARPADVTPHYDDGPWNFSGDTAGVSGKLKEIPDLPIVTLSRDLVRFPVANAGSPSRPAASSFTPEQMPRLRERYNDYGIGLLLQRDLRGAQAAFLEVTKIDPKYADGWVNVARARIEEGQHDAAREALEIALGLAPALPKAHYFLALTQKTVGRYDDAIAHLRTTLESFPRDRVVLNQLGRILFLQRRYDEAIDTFQRTLAVDPEDLQAHYNLMLCYRGKGDVEEAKREEALYARFKADESAQELTGQRRLQHPEENNERQLVHRHRSTWAPASPPSGYAGQ